MSEPATPDIADDSLETVGRADAEADAARSGADVEDQDAYDVGLDREGTDTDGEPVGEADADADARRSGADTGLL